MKIAKPESTKTAINIKGADGALAIELYDTSVKELQKLVTAALKPLLDGETIAWTDRAEAMKKAREYSKERKAKKAAEAKKADKKK